VVRAAVFVLAWAIFTLVVDTGTRPEDGQLGLRLLALAVLALAAAVWAATDGRRGVPLQELLIRWAVASLLIGLFVPLLAFLRAGGPTFDALAANLIVVTPLVAGLIFGPAAIAAAAGAMGAVRRRTGGSRPAGGSEPG